MHLGGSAWGPSFRTRRTVFCGVLVLLFSTTLTHGQDVAEAARQEQARKTAQPKASRHVYTDEDLKRQNILTPEDQARVEARKKQSQPAPAEENAERLPKVTEPQPESLGEVARRYRREQAARAAEQAEKKKFTPFPYQVPEGSLAVPKPGVAPRVDRSPRLELRGSAPPVPLLVPRRVPRGPLSHARTSPFQPRPFLSESHTPRVAPVAPAAEASGSSVLASIPHDSPLNPPVAPNRAGLQRVQVHRGESWWKLAEWYLGSGARWEELRGLNEEQPGPPELLKLGSIVLVPEKTEMRATSEQRSIKVRKGDTLWSLAHKHLGHGSAWTCLAQANPEVRDYRHMAIGAQLQLPEGQSLETCQGGSSARLPR